MRSQLLTAALATGALAARPFLNEPDTGIDEVLGDLPEGTLPELTSMIGLPDFDWAARHYLPLRNYTYYRNGAAGEFSYRNNLEVFHRYRLKPRVMVDITNIENTLPFVESINHSGPLLTCRLGPRSLATTSQPPSSSAPALVAPMATPKLS